MQACLTRSIISNYLKLFAFFMLAQIEHHCLNKVLFDSSFGFIAYKTPCAPSVIMTGKLCVSECIGAV